MDGLGSDDTFYQFSASGTDPDGVGWQISDHHTSQHQNPKASIFPDALHHKSTLIQMSV
jgi:hypothetical protein